MPQVSQIFIEIAFEIKEIVFKVPYFIGSNPAFGQRIVEDMVNC